MDLSLGIYQRIAALSGLATYAGAPAIFPDGRVPGDAAYPLCVILPATADDPHDTKTGPGRTVMVPIDVYDEASGDPATIERLAEELRAAFHRRPLDVGPWVGIITEVMGPVDTDTDDTLYGRRVVIRLGLGSTLAHA